ncbi:deoxyribodipyrimidine photo-lyase [Microbaculum marinum]|uniref:Deoxyribodipyrimidine photo-lyase n=1 Tax=Microbaculum marinum TaxID=1764581 RepID=A0AAW9S129_9HYPH
MISAGKPGQKETTLVWLRDDLRIRDNPALHAATLRDGAVVALYVLDDESDGIRPLGAASRWWLHGSLERLGDALAALGVPLVLRRGRSREVVPAAAIAANAGAVYWNRRYGSAEAAIDRDVETTLTEHGCAVETFAATLLHEPWTLRPASGPHYRVFSPFWKAALDQGEPRKPLGAPDIRNRRAFPLDTDVLADWKLRPTRPDWSGGLAETWRPGEEGARDRLEDFLDGGLEGYAANRDRPDCHATSMLSPHLRFGEISPFQVWHAVRSGEPGNDAEKFLTELGWREFSWHLLFHNPDLASVNFQKKFDAFAWRDDRTSLEAWQRGRTGIPMVDAGMRQLWHSGWMHNRVRMVAASFLIKNLMIDWREGEAWFWDTLVDADAANNPASWQWVAGSGADAAPYFRIFNPVLQGEKFDPEGRYVRTWVPELEGVPDRMIHKPWKAGASGSGGDYPQPIADLGETRRRALSAFKDLPG